MNNPHLKSHLEYNFFGLAKGLASYALFNLPNFSPAGHSVQKKMTPGASFNVTEFDTLRNYLPETPDKDDRFSTVLLRVDQQKDPFKEKHLSVVGHFGPLVFLENVRTDRMCDVGRYYHMQHILGGSGNARHTRGFLDEAAFNITQSLLVADAARKKDDTALLTLAEETLQDIYQAAPTLVPEAWELQAQIVGRSLPLDEKNGTTGPRMSLAI